MSYKTTLYNRKVVFSMYMKDVEIVNLYKMAVDKEKQIAILCQLNACPVESIVQILDQYGVYGKQVEPKPNKKAVPFYNEVDYDVSSGIRIDKRNTAEEERLEKLLDIRYETLMKLSEIEDEIEKLVKYNRITDKHIQRVT